MPATGGGGKTTTKASGISARTRAFILARIAGSFSSREVRSENSLKGRNTAAVFGRLPPKRLKPANSTVFRMPGEFAGFNLLDRKSTRLNSSHTVISYAVFCLKKKKAY